MTDDHLRILMTTNRVHMESSAPVPPTIFAQLYLIQVTPHLETIQKRVL